MTNMTLNILQNLVVGWEPSDGEKKESLIVLEFLSAREKLIGSNIIESNFIESNFMK